MLSCRLICLAAVLATVGCGGHALKLPEPRPLGAGLTDRPGVLEKRDLSEAPIPAPLGAITLEEALRLAIDASPNLRAAALEVWAAEARRIQAGVRSNPEVEVEVEDFGGTGPVRGFDSAVITSLLSQDLEFPGKRLQRKRVAALEVDIAGWDYESERLDILTETTAAFVNLLAAQEGLALSEELVHIAEQMHEMVSQRVAAGKVSPVEEAKASIALAMSRIERSRSQGDLAVARIRLAATWGSTVATFDRAEGQMDELSPAPPVEAITSLVSQNPEAARWETEVRHRKAALAMEKAGRVPDLTLGGGLQRSRETGEQTYIASVSVGLPLFDRGQGNVLERRHDLARALEEQKSAEVTVRVALAEAYENLRTAHEEAVTLRDVALPAIERTFEATLVSYRLGKVGYIDVLDAQRTLFEAKHAWIDVLTKYNLAVVDIERLVGQKLHAAGAPGTEKGE